MILIGVYEARVFRPGTYNNKSDQKAHLPIKERRRRKTYASRIARTSVKPPITPLYVVGEVGHRYHHSVITTPAQSVSPAAEYPYPGQTSCSFSCTYVNAMNTSVKTTSASLPSGYTNMGVTSPPKKRWKTGFCAVLGGRPISVTAIVVEERRVPLSADRDRV